MTVAQSVAWCNAQVGNGLNFDGVYGCQCFDFFCFYYQYVTGRNPYSDGYSSASGVDYARQIYAVPNNLFTHVLNNPNDPNQLPSQGAIMVLNQNIGGGAGHVQVYDTGDASGYWCWEQNWAGQYVEHRYHTWSSLSGMITGWMVYNGFQTAQTSNGGDEMIADATQAHEAYQLLRPNGDGNDDEISATAGKRTWQDFATGAEAERQQRDANLAAQGAQLAAMQASVDQLNTTLNAVTSDDKATKAQLQDALTQAAALTGKLTDAQIQVTTLQKQLATKPTTPVTKQPDAPRVDWSALFKNILGFLKSKLNKK